MEHVRLINKYGFAKKIRMRRDRIRQLLELTTPDKAVFYFLYTGSQSNSGTYIYKELDKDAFEIERKKYKKDAVVKYPREEQAVPYISDLEVLRESIRTASGVFQGSSDTLPPSSNHFLVQLATTNNAGRLPAFPFYSDGTP